MPQTLKPPPSNGGPKQPPGRSRRELLATRRGLLGVAFVVAVLGAAAILVFLARYRESVDAETRPVTVLVAKERIGAGTAGEVIADEELLQATRVPQSEAKDGAITDPASLRGRVATKEVFPGEQLTTGAFAAGGAPVESRLTGRDRAVSVSVDNAHGLVGHVRAGDRVDVLAGFLVDRGTGQPRPVLRTLVQDVLVLGAPAKRKEGSGSASKQEVVVRVDDEQAAALAFSAEYGKVWVTLRPPSRAEQSRIGAVTLDSLLVGLRPIKIDGGAGSETGGDR